MCVTARSWSHQQPQASLAPRQKANNNVAEVADLDIEEIQYPGHHLRLRIKDPHPWRNMEALKSSAEAAASLSG